jgi:catechol 2,3-dioxygenase-like lactoylglutathione lyase family enzyme
MAPWPDAEMPRPRIKTDRYWDLTATGDFKFAIESASRWNARMHPKTDGILESSLYVGEVAKSIHFCKRVFGFEVISDFGERGCAMQAGERQVLLLFKKGSSRNTSTPHDGDGELHLAFAISTLDFPNWEIWLAKNEIAVEQKRTWDRGGQSAYFRDPDRHLIELATPGVWSIY